GMTPPRPSSRYGRCSRAPQWDSRRGSSRDRGHGRPATPISALLTSALLTSALERLPGEVDRALMWQNLAMGDPRSSSDAAGTPDRSPRGVSPSPVSVGGRYGRRT